MKIKLIFIAILFVSIYGCSSVPFTPIELEAPLFVETFDRKTKSFEALPATVDLLGKDGELKVLRITTEKKHPIHFTPHYSREYLYFVEQFLAAPDTPKIETTISDIGDAHSFSRFHSLNFSVQYDNRKLLRITHCDEGNCNFRKAQYYSSSSVAQLHSILSSFDTKQGIVEPAFLPTVPGPEKARVYLYRMRTAPLAMRAPITLDRSELTALPSTTCVWFDLDKGSHVIGSDWGFMSTVRNDEIGLYARGGEVYFIKHSPNVSGKASRMLGVLYDRRLFRKVPEIVAKHDIKNCEALTK